MTNVLLGMEAYIEEPQGGDYTLKLVDNYFETAPREGIGQGIGFRFSTCCDDGNYQDSLNLLLERNTIKTTGVGVLVDNLGALINSAHIDLGWGSLGSEGQNRIFATGNWDIAVRRFDVSAVHNWWGRPDGPRIILELDGATVNVEPFLTSDPAE